MPFNGVGLFERIYQWGNDAANDLDVSSSRMDTDSNDIADGLTNCVTRDGQSPALANLPMGGFKFTGLADGSADTDSVNYGQVFNNPTFDGLTATGVVTFAGASTVNVPTATPGDNSTKAASTAFVANQAFSAALPAQSLGFLRSSGTVAGFTQTHTGYAQNEVKGADIASAATVNLTTATGNLVHITGAVQISAFTIPVGAEREIVFDGAPQLLHSASLILPGGGNLTADAGTCATIRGETTGARVTKWEPFSGRPIAPVPRMLVVTASQSWVVPASTFEVEGCGGGQAGTGNGRGGGCGGYVKKVFTGAVVGSTATIVIGAAGSTAGQVGGNSTFALSGFTTLTAEGGSTGNAAATGGDLNIPGVPGDGSEIYGYEIQQPSGQFELLSYGGNGASSPLGHGGVAPGGNDPLVTGGSAATGYGSGGTGGTNSTVFRPGTAGVWIIRY